MSINTGISLIETPLEIPNLTFWLNATNYKSFTFNIGNQISEWQDSSGNNRNFTQTVSVNQPIFSEISLNGKPGIVFNGTTHYFKYNYEALLNSRPLSIYVICKIVGSQDNYRAVLSSNNTAGSQGYVLFATTTNKLEFWMRDVFWWGGAGQGINSVILNKIELLTCKIIDTNNSRFDYNNGNGYGIFGTQLFNTTQEFRIGAYGASTPSQFFNGVIGEILFYKRILSTNENTKIVNYLANKWGAGLIA